VKEIGTRQLRHRISPYSGIGALLTAQCRT
jgi:hypothetical protein